MTRLGGFGVPGNGAADQTSERNIFWGGDDAKGKQTWMNAVFSSTMADAGATPTTACRAGLILGKIDSTGELAQFNADATDGTQNLAGILDLELWMADPSGNAADRVARVCVGGLVVASKLLIEGLAFVGHQDEYLLRRLLHLAGFRLDDDPFGYKAGVLQRIDTVTGTSDVLTADENGKLLIYSNAAAVAVTLPALKPGLEFDILRSGDEEIVISSAEGDNIIVGNDLSADSFTFTTASEHIGARVRVKSVYVGGTLKWLSEVPNTPFGVEVGSTISFAIGT